MTTKPDDAVVEATRKLLAHYSDADVTPGLRERVRRVAELLTLADRLRSSALRGDEFDLIALTRLETLASEALAALDLPERLSPPIATAPVEGAMPPNLTKLSNEQLAQLDALMSVACSVAPPSPDAVLSDRHVCAVAFAKELDDAEARGEIGRDLTPVAGIDRAFRDNLRGQIEAVLRPVLPLQVFDAGDLGLADLEVRLAAAERRAVAAEARAETAGKALVTAGKSGHGNNVVPLRVPAPEFAPCGGATQHQEA